MTATVNTPHPDTSGGSLMRRDASTNIQPAATTSNTAFKRAAITSARLRPKLYLSLGARAERDMATKATMRAKTSDPWWTVSASRAREPNRTAPTT